MGLSGQMWGSGEIPVRSFRLILTVLVLLGAAVVCVNGQPAKLVDPETNCLGLRNNVSAADLSTVRTMVDIISNKLKDIFMTMCHEITSDFVTGPEGGKKMSFYDTFSQAYHTLGIPVSRTTWVETYFFFEAIRPPLVEIRELNRDYEKFQQYHGKCTKYYNEGVALNNLDEKNRTLEDCIRISKVLDQCTKFHHDVVEDLLLQSDNEWLDRYHTACYESVVVLNEVFLKAVNPLSVNSRPPQWNYSPLYLMYLDTLEYTYEAQIRLYKTFPAYIKKIRADGDVVTAAALDARMRNFTYMSTYVRYYYLHIQYYSVDQLSDIWLNSIVEFTKNINNLYNNKSETRHGRLSHKEHIEGWRHDDKQKTNFKTEVWDWTFTDFATKLKEEYFETFFNVERYDPPVYPYDNFYGIFDFEYLWGDGMWKWEWDVRANLTLLTGMHNLRLAWDLMGALQEELKCLMRETYFFDLRQKAIRDTQLDLKKGALFMGISKTLFQPCRISYFNESDLVTPHCTAENHEICAPMAPFHPLQRPESIYHGGLGLLKPKWVFWYEEKQKKCVGRKDYVSIVYVCRCGFRLDCGDDLGENITCQLVPNDLLRGQCRGGVGYPCKTLPLSPGKHNQTCASGYCNMRKNSCEDNPQLFKKSDGAPIWKVHVLKHRFLVHFLAALVASVNGINRVRFSL